MDNNLQDNTVSQKKTKKKKTGLKTGLIVGIAVVVALVLLTAGAVLAFTLLGASPQKKANKAFDKMEDELAQYATVLDEVGFDKIAEYASSNPMHAYLDLSVTLPDSDSLGNLSVTFDGISDLSNDLWTADLEVGAYGFSLDLGELTYANDDIYLQSKFLGSNTYKIGLANFAKDFNNSGWSSMLDVEVPEDIMETYGDVTTLDYSEFWEELADVCKDIRSNMTFTSIKGKTAFEIDGKSVNCTGIEVAIDKDYVDGVINTFMSSMGDSFKKTVEAYGEYGLTDSELEEYDKLFEALESIEVTNDVVFDIYVDSNGRIVNMSTPEDIEFTNSSEDKLIQAVSFDFNFTGSERRTDVIDGEIYVKAQDNIICIEIDRNASVDDDKYTQNLTYSLSSDKSNSKCVVNYENTWENSDNSFDMVLSINLDEEDVLSVSANGNFEDVVSGEAYTLNIKNAIIAADGENQLILSAKYTYEPSNESIDVPTDAIDLLDMTTTEISSMLYGILGSVYSGLY